MVYNQHTWNSALYNAGRDQVGAVARSIISAHTGPHIQAVVGHKGGISLISDFGITEGTFTTPPSAFNFPDLSAFIRSTIAGTNAIPANIFGVSFKDLPACIFLVSQIPDLPANIFGLLHADLGGTLTGLLAQLDLPASMFIPQTELGGHIFGLAAPVLGGRIFGNTTGNLGAIIWAPQDLAAIITVLASNNLLADITAFQFRDLPARMTGTDAPILKAALRATASGIHNLPAYAVVAETATDDLPAELTASLDGFRTTLPVYIMASGGYLSIPSSIVPTVHATANLGGLIAQFTPVDLPAIIDLLGANNLLASVTMIPFGQRNRELPAFLQAVHPSDLSAILSANSNLHNLSAILTSLHATADLGAFIRADETFITAILKIITLNAVDLRATVGRPDCEGGSAYQTLLASATAQHARDLSAYLESYAQVNLGAVINTGSIIHAFDTIDVSYSRYRKRTSTTFRATDTILINYAPFRGANLSASITASSPFHNLGASIAASFLLPRVAPFITRLTGMDLRPGHDVNIQEVRLQLEGELTEFFYVHGTDDAFIMDASQRWQINIRSFRALAANLFGDFAAARVCRVGNIVSFNTLDEAVRFCIAAVLGLEGEAELGATINASGGIYNLRGRLGVSDKYKDLHAIANRVFPSDLLNADVTGTGGYLDLDVILLVTAHATSSLSATISPDVHADLSADLLPI